MVFMNNRQRFGEGLAMLSATLLLSSAAVAQSDAEGTAETPPTRDPITLVDHKAAEEGVFRFDFGVPSSPALNLLGQPEDKVTVVNGLKPFILQLPRLLRNDEGGQSLGLDFSPAWLLDRQSARTYDNYRTRGLAYRALYRTHIGGALYEGVADADPANARASRIAVGLSTSLLDNSDPLMAPSPEAAGVSAWQHCLRQGSSTMLAELRLISQGNERARIVNRDERRQLVARLEQLGPESAEAREIRARIDVLIAEDGARTESESTAARSQWADSAAAQVIPRCQREANIAARYGRSLAIGVGTLWNGDPGHLRNFSSGGWVAWAAFRNPLSSRFERDEHGELRPKSYWMVGFSGRFGLDEIVATNDATMPQVQANVFDGWAGLERLTPASRLALQVGYQIRDTEGRLASFDRERLRYFISYAQRLSDANTGVWLQVGYGQARSGDNNDGAFTVSLIFAPPSAANLFGTN